MLIGTHTIIYSTNSEADRSFLRDVLSLPNVDVGDGWLIFGLPPSEVAVHPSDENDLHKFYLMCEDVTAFVARMKKHNIACSPVQDQGWGLLTDITLPGGGTLSIYQPRHARPRTPGAAASTKKPVRRATKKRVSPAPRKKPKAKARRR